MIRETLAQCIELFNSDPVNQRMAIRGMEQLGEWGPAASYWEKLGDYDNSNACRYIQDSIIRGDCYRQAVKHLVDWVETTVDQGIMSKDEATKQIYPELHRLYNVHYPQSYKSC